MSTPKKVTSGLMALFVLASLFGFSTQTAQAAAQAAQTCTQYHTIQRGETLYSIGLQYDMTWTKLAEINNIANPGKIYAGQKLCVAVSSGSTPQVPTTGGKIPTFRIVSVVKDQSVTIETANFPANDSFNVTMGEFGTRGVKGVKVATTASGKGGTFQATYTIPADFKGDYRVAIRLESPTSGYFSYNWFYNNTSGTGTGGVDEPGGSTGYTGFPTFSIVSVAQDSTVTIKGNNFPANTSFNVLMGKYGTKGINGIRVTTVDSGQGGAFTATYNIPPELQGQGRIAIRLESPTTGYFAFNWFWNN